MMSARSAWCSVAFYPPHPTYPSLLPPSPLPFSYNGIIRAGSPARDGGRVFCDLTRLTALFKLDRFDAFVEDFLDVVLLMKNMGGDLNHLDHEENSVLMRTKNDAFGVALVRAGALTYYDKKGWVRRALAVAAAHGCLLTMEAIAFRDHPGQDYVDRCFHTAALQLCRTIGVL